jgi:hypothetical protein
MNIHNDNISELVDKIFTLKCPHCNTVSSLTLISAPIYSYLRRYRPSKTGIVYMCNSCNEPIFLKFGILNYDYHNARIVISENPIQIEFPSIDFEFEFLPEPIKSDFKEALTCYSVGAHNAFAAMTRRTIQSVATEMGAKGKDKVQRQIQDLKDIANIDDETFEIINHIILDGHDGSHPHLPSISPERSKILLELMNDIMYQLYVRKGKIKKATDLRKDQTNTKS